jgi:Phage tail assembly chaperone protein, TAC
MRRLPWDAWLRFALGGLGVPLDRVWSLTPRELALALDCLAPPGTDRLSRRDFTRLMAEHPDPSLTTMSQD